MKDRSPAHLSAPAGGESEVVGRARHDRAKASDGQRWTLDLADEAIADRLLSLGIAGVGGFVDGGRDAGLVWLFRKLAATSLADRLRERRGAWPPSEALAIGLSIARALSSCERQALFPGPISPETIAVDGTSATIHAEAFVRSALGAHDAGALALAAEISPRWTPPEQAGGAVWDGAANRYVLGLLLYRLLGGEHPFAGAGLRHALEEAAKHEPPPFVESVARDLPAGLQSFVLRMLAPDASERPANAQAIVEALTGFLRGDGSTTKRATARSTSDRERERPPREAAAADRRSPIPAVARAPERQRDDRPSDAERRGARDRDRDRDDRAHTRDRDDRGDRRDRDPRGEKARSATSSAVRFWPLAAGAAVALGALSLLAPAPEKPRVTAAIETTVPLLQDDTASQDCAKCHSRQT